MSAPRAASTLTGFLAVAAKDLRLEWRSRARLNATVFFALLMLLLFSLAMGPDHKLHARTAPGFLWLAMLMASVMSLSESMRIEAENDCLEGLRLLAIPPVALFLAKAIVNTCMLVLLGLVVLPVMIAIFDVQVRLGAPSLLGLVALGSAALSAPGTLYAAMVTRAKARDVLMPLLLFPLLVPCLLAAVKATALVLDGDAMGQLGSWATLLGGAAAIYWVLCAILFRSVIED